MAKRLGCKLLARPPMIVKVADGGKLQCDMVVKNFQWKMRGFTFSTDVYLMPLGGCDMVLGVQWFATLGNIELNTQEHTMAFFYHNQMVFLRGTKQKQLSHMSKGDLSKVKQQGGELSLLQLTAIEGQDSLSQVQLKPLVEASQKSLELQQVLEMYGDVFLDSMQLPPFREGFDHKIPLKEFTTDVHLRPYRYPLIQKDVIGSGYYKD